MVELSQLGRRFTGPNRVRREDAELLEAARRDPEQFGPFYRRYYPDVVRFLYSRCNDEEAAGGLAQETMARAFVELAHKGRKVYSPIPWLFTIASRELCKWRTERSHESLAAEISDLLLPQPSSVQRFLARDEVHVALAQLNDTDAAILVMVDVLGVTVREAAEGLGLTKAAGDKRIQRARLKMRELLSDGRR